MPSCTPVNSFDNSITTITSTSRENADDATKLALITTLATTTHAQIENVLKRINNQD